MDGQDIQDKDLRFKELTEKIIGCSFEVINELGSGFVESVYEKALIIALADAGIAAESQKGIQVISRSQKVGDFYADLLVEGRVIVELKAIKALLLEHHAQIINYLNATGLEVGLLINFGHPKLEFKRFTRSKNRE